MNRDRVDAGVIAVHRVAGAPQLVRHGRALSGFHPDDHALFSRSALQRLLQMGIELRRCLGVRTRRQKRPRDRAATETMDEGPLGHSVPAPLHRKRCARPSRAAHLLQNQPVGRTAFSSVNGPRCAEVVRL